MQAGFIYRDSAAVCAHTSSFSSSDVACVRQCVTSTLFVPCTVSSELSSRLRTSKNVVSNHNYRYHQTSSHSFATATFRRWRCWPISAAAAAAARWRSLRRIRSAMTSDLRRTFRSPESTSASGDRPTRDSVTRHQMSPLLFRRSP